MNDTDKKPVEKYTAQMEGLRSADSSEFAHLSDQIYLDHAANAVYMASAVEAFTRKLTSKTVSTAGWSLFSNPHSHSQSAQYTGMCIELIREKILQTLFNTNSREYDLVFVHNATQALKLVAESFNFGGDGARFVYLSDNHTSVVGMREIVWQKRSPRVGVYCLNEDEEAGSFATRQIDPPFDLKTEVFNLEEHDRQLNVSFKS
jgi:selenocysteine lyase/cysteine desulfurase